MIQLTRETLEFLLSLEDKQASGIILAWDSHLRVESRDIQVFFNGKKSHFELKASLNARDLKLESIIDWNKLPSRIVTLVPRDRKAKNTLANNGTEWGVIRETDKVFFSDKKGNWLLLQSEKNKNFLHWVNEKEDEEFQIK